MIWGQIGRIDMSFSIFLNNRIMRNGIDWLRFILIVDILDVRGFWCMRLLKLWILYWFRFCCLSRSLTGRWRGIRGARAWSRSRWRLAGDRLAGSCCLGLRGTGRSSSYTRMCGTTNRLRAAQSNSTFTCLSSAICFVRALMTCQSWPWVASCLSRSVDSTLWWSMTR